VREQKMKGFYNSRAGSGLAPPSPAINPRAARRNRAQMLLRSPHTARVAPRNPPFLIASRQILEIELTHSQQTRKDFLIASFLPLFGCTPHLTIQQTLLEACKLLIDRRGEITVSREAPEESKIGGIAAILKELS